MKGKASDICPKCKHCEGMVAYSFYVCGDSHSDGGLYHLIGSEDELYCTAYEEEANMNKVKGKVSDFCPKCKNCKGTTKESNGVHDWLTEVECEDPYDGMTKTLDADSNICCSMFEEKKEKEPFDLNMPREAIKAIAKLNDVICELEKEKSDHLKGIERLKKSQEKLQNQVKNLQTTNEESYKREEKLEDKVRKLEKRLLDESKRRASLDTEFLIPLANVLYPREAKICKPYSEVLKDIKLLNKGVYDLEEDNKRLADKNKELEERYHKAETDVTTLNSKVDVLKNKNDKYLKKIEDQQVTHYKQCARIMDLEFAVNKLQSGEYDDILAKDIEIKSLQAKYEDVMAGWNHTMESHDKSIQTIEEQKAKIEALKTNIDILQDAILEIHNIAQKAYNDIDED